MTGHGEMGPLLAESARLISQRLELGDTARSRLEVIIDLTEGAGGPVSVADVFQAWDLPHDDATSLATANRRLSELVREVGQEANESKISFAIDLRGGDKLGTAREVVIAGFSADAAGNHNRDVSGVGSAAITDQRVIPTNEAGKTILRVAVCHHSSEREEAEAAYAKVVTALTATDVCEIGQVDFLDETSSTDMSDISLDRAGLVFLFLSPAFAAATAFADKAADGPARHAIRCPIALRALPKPQRGTTSEPVEQPTTGWRSLQEVDRERPLEGASDEERTAVFNRAAEYIASRVLEQPLPTRLPDHHQEPEPRTKDAKRSVAGLDPAGHDHGDRQRAEDALDEDLPRVPGYRTDLKTSERLSPGSQAGLALMYEWVDQASKDRPPLLALLGESGSGKTVLAQMFDNGLRQRIARGEGHLPHPYLFDLRDLTGLAARSQRDEHRVPTFTEVMEECMERGWSHVGARTARDLLDLSHQRPCIFIFDGLDEALVNFSNSDALNFVSNLLRLRPEPEPELGGQSNSLVGPNTQIVLTCRNHFFKDLADQQAFFTEQDRRQTKVADYLTIQLQPFTDEQVNSYLIKALPERDADEVVAMLGSVHDLTDLTSRPFTLSQVVEELPAIEAIAAAGGTVSAGAVYRLIIKRWLTRDAGKHQVEAEHKQRLLPRLAAWAWNRGERTIDCSTVNEWFWDAIKGDTVLAEHYGSARDRTKPERREAAEKLEEDLRTATFLVRSERPPKQGAPPGSQPTSEFRFAHTSFQEYFVAEYLLRAVAADRRADWAALSTVEPSRETLAFFADLLAGHAETEALLATLNRWRETPDEASRLLFRYALAARREGWKGPALARFAVHNADLAEWKFEAEEGGPMLNLAGIDLTGCQLRDTVWSRAVLSGAILSEAAMPRARLHACTMAGATLHGTDLTGSFWHRCAVSDADLGEEDPATLRAIRGVGTGPAGAFFPPAHPPASLRPATLEGHTGGVWGVAVDGDQIVSASDDGTVRVWDRWTHQSVATLEGHTGRVLGVAVDGDQIVSASRDGTVRVWDRWTHQSVATLEGHTGGVWGVAVDGDQIVSASDDGTVRVWDRWTHQPVAILEGHTGRVLGVAVDGDQIVSASSDGTVRVWDRWTHQPVATLEGHTGWVLGVAVDGDQIVSASRDGTVRVWDRWTHQPVAILEGHTGGVLGVAVDGDQIVSASTDGTVRVWDRWTHQPVATLEGHTGGVLGVAVDGDQIVSASTDGTVRVWDRWTHQPVAILEGHTGGVWGVAVDGDQIVSASSDGTVRVWDRWTHQPVAILKGHTGAVRGVAVDGDQIVSASRDGTVRVWNRWTHQPVAILKGHTGAVWGVAVDGDQIVSAGNDGTVRVWDRWTHQPVATLEGHTGRVLGVAVDGDQIVSASRDGTVRVWDRWTHQPVAILKGHTGRVLGVAVDGDQIVSASRDGTVRVWDRWTHQPVAILKGHTGAVWGVAVDGDQIVSASTDGTVRVWDRWTHQPVAILKGHTGGVLGVAVDGDQIVSASNDKTVRVWDRRTYEPVAILTGLPEGESMSCHPDTGAILGASPGAWRHLFLIGRDEEGRYLGSFPYELMQQA